MPILAPSGASISFISPLGSSAAGQTSISSLVPSVTLFLVGKSDFSDSAARSCLASMRAVLMPDHGGPEVLRVDDVERRTPGAGEVLIEMRAAGLNPVDTQVRAGDWVPAETGKPPMILGWDVAGVVAEAREGVASVAPGDRVFGMPSFPELARCDAEYVIAAEARIARTPDALTDEQAGALPLAGLTAWQALVEQ